MDLNPQVLSALVGAFVAGFFAIVIGILAHQREERRRKQEQVQREFDWFREKVLEAYSGCLCYLLRLGVSAVKCKPGSAPEVLKDFTESLRYLFRLHAYNPNNGEAERIGACHKCIWDRWDQTSELAKAADDAAILVRDLLKNDVRVKSTNESVPNSCQANISASSVSGGDKET